MWEEIRGFIGTQLLDMRYLDEYVASWLWRGGLDPASPLGATAQLIVCNVIKLTILLVVSGVIRGMLHRLFAPERCREALFSRGAAAAWAGALTGASLPKADEASLPSRFGALVGRGMAPEAAGALLFAAPFADPFTFMIGLTMAFGVRDALLCTLSGGVLAVLGGMLIGHLCRQGRSTDDAQTPDAGKRTPEVPHLRDVPGKALAEIRYIFPYIVLGAGAGAFIRNWVPESWVQTLLGTSDPLAVCLAVVAGMPLGADLFCIVPVVVELQAKGAHPGVLTAFVLSATAFTPSALFAFKRAMKPRMLLLIYLLCLIRAAGVGCLINSLPEFFK